MCLLLQFSSGLVEQLADSQTAKHTPSHGSLDEHVRQRIAKEIARLRKEEADVVAAVESALAKENMGKEANVAGVSSDSVNKDVEGIMDRLHRNKVHRDTLQNLVGEARQGLLQCLKDNKEKSLECAPEVSAFKTAIQTVEKVRSLARSRNLPRVMCCVSRLWPFGRVLQEFIASV